MTTQLIRPRTMSGVLELLPKEQLAFDRFLATIRLGYERFAFIPIETPLIEHTDILLTKSGGETERQLYFVQATGALQRQPELALRFDLTVPLARYVAEHEADLLFPFRRYHIGRVYRGESAQRGRFREFYQCDIDIIGKNELSLAADAEIPVVVYHVFQQLGIGKFTISLNNRKLMLGLFEELGIRDAAQRTGILREIDKLDKRGREHVVRALTGEPYSISAAALDGIFSLIELRGEPQDVLAAMERMPVSSATFRAGLSELTSVIEAVGAMRVAREYFTINPAIARGLDYYTGTVYETTLDDHPEIGSICSGGRYENLASYYTRTRLPGVGISIGATRLFYQLREVGLIRAEQSSVKVLVAQMDDNLKTHYLDVATRLREAGINTEVHYEGWKLGKQLTYAGKARIPFVVLIGQEERARAEVRVKKLATGEQIDMALDQLVPFLQAEVPQTTTY